MALKNLVPWRRSESNIPVRRSAQVPFYQLQHGIDQLFDDFLGESMNFGLQSFEGTFSPTVDVSETDKEIKISAELPGLDEKDIEVSLSNDVLTISGEKKSEHEDKGENYHRIERSYGSFQRSIALPGEVDADQVDAKFKNGVLQITLPKTAPTHSKRIEVKSS